MTRRLEVRTVMTPFPYSVGVDDPLDRARRLMSRHRLRHIPVKDRDRLVGVVTDRDLKLVLGPYVQGGAGDHLRVRDACVFHAFQAELDTPVAHVAAEMARLKVGSALITKDGRLAGIFTATDACRVLSEILASREEAPPPEDAA